MVTTQREKAEHNKGRKDFVALNFVTWYARMCFEDSERLCGPDSVHWNFSG
ncbi:hypothetical protein [Streptomyces sp. NPDC048419]|uniref:hypothetical protein n=1 Tax=Streptomyces sp. NPDC048419 TaxID=3365547 RepID=UPI00371EC778